MRCLDGVGLRVDGAGGHSENPWTRLFFGLGKIVILDDLCIRMVFLGVVRLVKDEEIDLSHCYVAAREALQQDISCTHDYPVLGEVLSPDNLVVLVGVHRTAETCNFVVEVRFEDGVLLEYERHRSHEEERDPGRITQCSRFELLINDPADKKYRDESLAGACVEHRDGVFLFGSLEEFQLVLSRILDDLIALLFCNQFVDTEKLVDDLFERFVLVFSSSHRLLCCLGLEP